MKALNIVFMGTPDFAVESLRKLHQSHHQIVGVVTVMDKPAGRGQKLTSSAVKTYAEKENLPVLQPEKLKDESFIKALQLLQADLFVVVAFRMLPEAVWAMPPLGTINLHGSLLPNYRGAAPINWAVINGDNKTGCTTFFIEKEIDTGKIINFIETPIGEDTTAGELHDELMEKGADLVLKTVNNIAMGNVNPINQSDLINNAHREAPKIHKETCKIDWSKSALRCHNHIRGLSPYPAAWTTLCHNGDLIPVKIFKAKIEKGNGKAGSIYTNNKDFLTVYCGSEALHITELQMAGKKRLIIKDFLNGIKINQNDYFI